MVGVFKRYESVAIRGRVRPGGVQRLIELEGRGDGLVRDRGRRRGSDGSVNTVSSHLARTPSDSRELRRNSSPAVAAEESRTVVRWGEFNDEELRG